MKTYTRVLSNGSVMKITPPVPCEKCGKWCAGRKDAMRNACAAK